MDFQDEVKEQVLEAARMLVTQGLGEGAAAHGFFIIVGDTKEILSGEKLPVDDVVHCNYGTFRTDLDRRGDNLMISECVGKRSRNFKHLFHADGAVVVDGESGHVCCGGFKVSDTAKGIDRGGARTKAASAMAEQAGGCYIVFASQEICASSNIELPPSAAFEVFDQETEPVLVPVRESDTLADPLEQWLRPLKFSADLCLYKDHFVEGTREWVIGLVEAWRRGSDSLRCRVLLAGPGFGKTTIAARLKEKMPWVLAIHLCRHSDSFKRDPRRMVASIAHQIAKKLPKFRKALRKVRNAEGGDTTAFSLRPTARELADCLLFNPLREMKPPPKCNHNGRHVIIIDALDEADHDSKHDLLDLVAFDFHKLPPWVALLVTARPEVDIIMRLAPLGPTLLDAETYKNDCDDDVRVYLRSVLAARFSGDIGAIVTKSEGLFLYLRYMCNMLESCDDINALPIGLAFEYQKQLERVLGPAGLGDRNSQMRRVVEAIIAAQVPVHIKEELPQLSGVPNEMVLERVARLSLLLPVRDDDRVYIFHKSFVNWLTCDGFKRTLGKPAFIIDRRAAHFRLASACSVPLVRVLSEQAGRFKSDAHAVAAIQRSVEARGCVVDDSKQSLALNEYAFRWSLSHLFEAGGLEDVSLALLHSLQFLLKRASQIDTLIGDAARLRPATTLLHRALILAQNHVEKHGEEWLAEELWQRLLTSTASCDTNELERLARDAQIKARADLMFSARRTYFTPADSSLRCVLERHSCEVKSVTAFADAQGHMRVASCSSDKTVCIWDPTVGGKAVHVRQWHAEEVNGVTAFVDNTGHLWVASYSSDATVRIWDPMEGGGEAEAIHVLKGHSQEVNGVTAFMGGTDRLWVASCSSDTTVRIWDPTQGNKAVHVLKDHSDGVKGVTNFVDSEDHRWVASCSDDKTICIWDPIKGGDAACVLKGHSGDVNGVTTFFDAEGNTCVASCSGDKTVCIWNLSLSRGAVHVLTGHSKEVKGVTAFEDASGYKRVASYSDDLTVRIWDPIKGSESFVIPLEGRATAISTLPAGSSHAGAGVCLVIGHEDGRLSYWDHSRQWRQRSEGQQQ